MVYFQELFRINRRIVKFSSIQGIELTKTNDKAIRHGIKYFYCKNARINILK